MTDKSRKIPQIRFDGFSEEWEEKTLGEHAEILTGGTPKTTMSEYWAPKEIPWMSSGEVNKRRLDETDNMISVKGLKNSSARWVKEYSVLIALAAQGKTRGTVAINNVRLTTNQSIGAIIPNDNLHYEFVFQNLIKRYDELRMISSGDGTRGGLNKKILSSLLVQCPSKEEQQKIGTFFKQLDESIALHQSEYELLVKTKQSYLQKMFPKKGESVPEIRFAGFTEEWEERKLGGFTERIRGNDGRMDLPTLTMSAAVGWMSQEERFSSNIAGKEQKNYTLLKEGELSYNHGNSKLAKYGVVFVLKDYKEALVPRVYHSFKVMKGSPLFIEQYFASKLPDRELGKLVSSGARMDGLLNINYESFINIKLTVPCENEQTKIGNFFKQLDEIITLQQKELSNLKEMKKRLLQLMFV